MVLNEYVEPNIFQITSGSLKKFFSEFMVPGQVFSLITILKKGRMFFTNLEDAIPCFRKVIP